jgi:Domain of unknown function (DUF4124)/Aspartyl protease
MSRRRAALGITVSMLALASVSPADAQYYRWTDERGNSHYTDGLQNVPERYRSTAVPLRLRSSPRSPDPAPPGAAPSEATARPAVTPGVGSTTIRYTPGQPIWVDVTINGRARARLVLEPDAEVTQISPTALASAGVSVPAAGGAPSQVTVNSLALGEARVDGLSVAAQELRLSEDGLLGRDFLDRFKLTNDRDGGVLTLTPR